MKGRMAQAMGIGHGYCTNGRAASGASSMLPAMSLCRMCWRLEVSAACMV